MSDSNLTAARIVRHIRYLAKNHCDVESKGGVTFLFNLDYLRRTVDVLFAVCSTNDNFCKSDGIRYAAELGVERTLQLDEFQKDANKNEHAGFVSAYLNIIMANRCIGINSEREDNLLRKLANKAIV